MPGSCGHLNLGEGEAPCVLVHGYVGFSDPEVRFWSEVREGLLRSGYEMVLVHAGDSPNGEYGGVPHAGVISSLDGYGLVARLACECEVPNTDVLLARESLWYGEEVPHVAGSGGGRRHAMQYVQRMYGALLDDARPALVVIHNGQHPVEMILEQLARSRGIPVVFFERGPLPLTYHLDDSGITVNTEAGRRTDVMWAAEPEPWRRSLIGYERAYRDGGVTWWEQPEGHGSSLRNRLAVPDGKRMVLFAGQIDADTANFLNGPLHGTNLEAFAWFCESLRPMQDEVFIVGKNHPRSKTPPEAFRQVVGDLGAWVDDVPLKECLDQVDRVAAVNSTVVFEALMYRKPVLTMGRSILSGKGIAHEITCLDDGVCCGVLRGWLANDAAEERFSRWVDLGASLLSDCLFQMAPLAEERYLGATSLAEALAGRARTDAKVGTVRLPGFRLLTSMARDGELMVAVRRMLRSELRSRVGDSEWLAKNASGVACAKAVARRLAMKVRKWFGTQ